jgi:DNA polymerase I
VIVLDIETEAIVDYAPLLPKPVGVAIQLGDTPPLYMAWDHPSGNTHERGYVAAYLRNIWGSSVPILTHNGCVFDIPVLEHWFDLPKIDPLRVHDTMLCAYLHNPHSQQLGLKWLAEHWCGIPNDDQTELQNWILENTVCKTRSKAGAYISQAPGDLVGKYAISDVTMTKALWDYVSPLVLPTMGEAYDRERTLAPILVEMQNRGVLCDRDRLQADYAKSTERLCELDNNIRAKLKVPSLEITKDAQLVAALQAAGHTEFLRTEKTGKPSTSNDSLDKALTGDPELRAMLKERATLATLTGTFMSAWLEAADANGGRIHAAYNQTRNPAGFGTRTGRLSSSKPNFQNVPKDLGPEYPNMRSYLLPDEGCVWVTGDFKSQEPRIAAHFEDGALCRAFDENPSLDQYLWIADLCKITRKEAKVVLLGLLYAMGPARLSEALECDMAHATHLKAVIKDAMPDIVKLDYECKRRFQLGQPIKTLGGRLYFCEPPTDGRTWEYKALNVLVQGSAADQTKAALIYIHKRLLPGERILGTVHDEISISCKPERVDAVIKLLEQAASALACDVPMLMECGYGANWAEAK